MKKLITLVVCCCCAAIFAGDVEIKDLLKRSKIGAAAMPGWGPNKSSKLIGKGVVVQGSEKDEKAFKITSDKVQTAFYKYSPIKVKAGDKVKISADVKGKGTFSAGFYTYMNGSKYFDSNGRIKNIKLNGQKQEIEFEFVVQNGKKGEVTDAIRPYVAAGAKSEVIIEDLEIEIDYKDR